MDLLFVGPKEAGPWSYSLRKVQGWSKRWARGGRPCDSKTQDLRHTYATLLLIAHQSPGYV